jgi:predicted metal-dependent enzyme (double-stranded beta helix superfamily)
MTKPSDLSRLVAELRAITAEHAQPRRIIELVRPLMAGLAPDPARADPRGRLHQGWRYPLHEEPDHGLALFAQSWPRGAATPPHTHGTWAVIVGILGCETNTFWTRTDDGNRPGHATLHKGAERSFGPGDVVTLLPDAIHSVVNTTSASTLTIEVYGRNPNHTGRSRFDVDRGLEIPIASGKELVR